MAKHATTLSEIQEQEYEDAFSLMVRAGLATVGLALAAYFSRLFEVVWLQFFFLILTGAGVLVVAYAVVRIVRARNRPFVTLDCPYCQFPMRFPAAPKEDFDCESCHRRVYFEDDGRMADVADVTCTSCRTRHRVSVKAVRFVCDVCNRPLNLEGRNQAASGATGSELAEAYNVALTEVGRRPADVALAVQDMLVCNMVEARRRMQNLPLLVAENVPMRKADAVGRRLEDLGAAVAIRPAGAQPRGGRA